MNTRQLIRLGWLFVIVAVVSLACNLPLAQQNGGNNPLPSSSNAEVTATSLTPYPSSRTSSAGIQVLEERQLFQDGALVRAVFFVQNLDPVLAYPLSMYTVNVSNAAGTVIGARDGFIDVVLPGEKQAVVVDVYLESEAEVAASFQVEVQTDEEVEVGNIGPLFTVLQSNIILDQNFPKVTGRIQSKTPNNITDVGVTAVIFDASGAIIGAGYSSVSFILAGEESGVVVPVMNSGEPTRIEMYPSLSGVSSLSANSEDSQLLEVVASGFSQAGWEVGAGFTFKNNNTEQAVRESRYQIIAYNAAGIVLGAADGNLTYIYPGETNAVYSSIYTPENMTADRVQVQVLSGFTEAPYRSTNPYQAGSIQYLPGSFTSYASAVLTSELPETTTDLIVTSLLLNPAGEIIGGGYTYENFLPGGGTTGCAIPVTSVQEPATVGFYIRPSDLTANANHPEGLSVTAAGFGGDSFSTVAGFIVQNMDSSQTIEGVLYRVSGYNREGVVVASDSGYLPALFPGQTTGYSASLFPAEQTQITSITVDITSGFRGTASVSNFPIRVVTAQLVPDAAFPGITGILHNDSEVPVQSLVVTALAYDAAGKIIGAGSTYVDSIAALGEIPVDVSLSLSGEVARVELYPSLLSLSMLEP